MTIVFGMRWSPLLNLMTDVSETNSSWCSGLAKHSSERSFFGQIRYLYPPAWLKAMYQLTLTTEPAFHL